MPVINPQGKLVISKASRNSSLLTCRRNLIFMPARKSIFISTLASCKDIDDNRSHMSLKIATLNPKRVSIFKMKASQDRGIASFKLLVL